MMFCKSGPWCFLLLVLNKLLPQGQLDHLVGGQSGFESQAGQMPKKLVKSITTLLKCVRVVTSFAFALLHTVITVVPCDCESTKQ